VLHGAGLRAQKLEPIWVSAISLWIASVASFRRQGAMSAFNITIHQFSPRSSDGWRHPMMQGFRLFSGAGSTGGWNEWDRRLGGRDQG
jgi:hypothetical protein